MALKGKQKKLDRNNNNRIDAQDFKILKAEKAKGRGMGLQDEKVKPGKVMKAKRGSGLDLPVIKSVKPKINKKSLHKNLMKTKNPYSDLVKTTAKGPRRFSSMAEMRKAKGFKPGETASEFNKRRLELARAKDAAKALGPRGKIALGVAAAGVGAIQYLKSKMKKKKEEPKKKMGGGMMKRPMGYSKGMSIKGDNKRDIRKTESMIGASKSSPREKSMKKRMGGGMMNKPMGYKTGGGYDAGNPGKIRDMIANPKFRMRRRDLSEMEKKSARKFVDKENRKEKMKSILKMGTPAGAALGVVKKSLDILKGSKFPKSGMGGAGRRGSINRRPVKKIPVMEARTGQMVMARGCKLGRKKATKIT